MNEERIALQDPRAGMMPERMALSPQEAADVLGLSRPTVYELMHRADFPSFSAGSRRLIPTEDLREWVREQVAKERARKGAGA